MAPTLVASRTTLPPEGAELAWGGPARRSMAPTLVTSCTALPPEGVELAWGGPAPRSLAPTLVASRTTLPPEGAELAWGGPARRPVAPTLFASSHLLRPGVNQGGQKLQKYQAPSSRASSSCPEPHTDLEQGLRHCERSAAVHAFGSHGLLHFVRKDESVHGKAKGRGDSSRIKRGRGLPRFARNDEQLVHWYFLAP